MKVSELKYERCPIERIREEAGGALERVRAAGSADEILAARRDYLGIMDDYSTAVSLAHMRFTLNTKDEFYNGEVAYYDEISPEAETIAADYGRAMLESPFRPELERRLSPVLFKSFEAAAKAVDPKIVPDMQEENALVTEYSKFMSGLVFSFRGRRLPLTLLRGFMTDGDRATRREAYEALGRGLEEASDTLDGLFDRLVKVRSRMAAKLGYKSFVELGYYRMGRLCYDERMVDVFRANVREDLVPVVSRLKARVARRLGIEDFRLYDDAVCLPGGNPKPIKDAAGILGAAGTMYRAMSPETGRFIDMMLENEAFDLLSRENKWGGGYCTEFKKYRQPFILANFNGTSADVDVITHEAGHAFASYMTFDNPIGELGVGGMETAETHSMSMEFFAWPYMGAFFGENEGRYRYAHLFDALSFIPYGCAVDHFQHIVYERPEFTPAERDAEWNRLEAAYRPWLSTEGITYLSKGTRWQYQMHIYETPFYYIDYCLAQVTALQFLLESLKDYPDAFKRYFRLLCHGGELVFTDLVREAGLASPFADGALKAVAEKIGRVVTGLER